MRLLHKERTHKRTHRMTSSIARIHGSNQLRSAPKSGSVEKWALEHYHKHETFADEACQSFLMSGRSNDQPKQQLDVMYIRKSFLSGGSRSKTIKNQFKYVTQFPTGYEPGLEHTATDRPNSQYYDSYLSYIRKRAVRAVLTHSRSSPPTTTK